MTGKPAAVNASDVYLRDKELIQLQGLSFLRDGLRLADGGNCGPKSTILNRLDSPTLRRSLNQLEQAIVPQIVPTWLGQFRLFWEADRISVPTGAVTWPAYYRAACRSRAIQTISVKCAAAMSLPGHGDRGQQWNVNDGHIFLSYWS